MSYLLANKSIINDLFFRVHMSAQITSISSIWKQFENRMLFLISFFPVSCTAVDLQGGCWPSLDCRYRFWPSLRRPLGEWLCTCVCAALWWLQCWLSAFAYQDLWAGWMMKHEKYIWMGSVWKWEKNVSPQMWFISFDCVNWINRAEV